MMSRNKVARKLRRSLATVAAAAGLLTAAGASASVYDTSALGELTGSRSVGNGLTIGGGNATTASISWTITPISGGYNYSYSFTTNSQQNSLSHFILDLTDSCTATSGCVIDPTKSTEFGTFSSSQGSSNVFLPTAITGVKFAGSASLPWTVSFDSNRVPVYGDFYSKNGNPPRNGYAIYNTGNANHASNNIIDFIARPDTVSPPPPTGVPEPTGLALLGLGIAGLGAARRKKTEA